MIGLRNPFAVRKGKILLIEDLSLNERGLKCQCQCPACNGEFIARMGDVKVHHFAHCKDSCDEILAYTSGLYKLIKQILDSDTPFYVPALVVSYDFPHGDVLNENNMEGYIKIVGENNGIKDTITISVGRCINFESAELCYDSKLHIQALELTYMNSKMAVKVMPPDTVCKTATVSSHKDMATLVLDFTSDADMIQTSSSTAFQDYMLSDRLDKFWIYNPKVRRVYPQIIELSEKAHREWVECQKQLEEKRKLEAQKFEKARKHATEQQVTQPETQERLFAESRMTKFAVDKEKQIELLALGYEQVKDRFTQQTEQIRDNYNHRWVQCELCGEIKVESEFSSYGGFNHVNLGQCTICARKRERREN